MARENEDRMASPEGVRDVHDRRGPTLNVPVHVAELHTDLSRARVINVVGGNRKGEHVQMHLKITRKGGLTLF